ncbi:MAG: hypothetical protein ABFS35_02360 [Bacteroidota bacterium]
MTTITEKYRTLSKHITAHATLKGQGEYLPLTDRLNELIDEYNLLIKRRVGNNADKGEIKAEDPEMD